MEPNRYQRLKQLFQDALERETAARDAFLDEACSGDSTLREMVDSLLVHHAADGAGFLRQTEELEEGESGGLAVLELGGVGRPLLQLGCPSAVFSVDREGRLGRGVKLTELRDEPKLPELTTGAEKYEVLGVLGEGGMGKVYLAYDQDLRRTVALKMLQRDTATLAARFVEEAQVMGQLEHPSIVTVHELGVTPDKRLYYTMPVVRGQTVQQILRGLRAGEARLRGRYTLTRLVQIFQRVVEAVAYAHDKGVVHRDLKPANVMVGEHGEVQVLDWGLSKVLGGSGVETTARGPLTRRSVMMGTPSYMSPEQIRGGRLDGRSDIYALGVMLFELLTHRLPFRGRSTDVLVAHLTGEPPAPRAAAGDRHVPLELERVCLKALAKDPGERHRTAGELGEEVQAWLEAEADRTKRHELAEARADEGERRFERFRRLKEKVARLETELAATARRFQAWEPEESKDELFAAEDRLERGRDELVRTESRIVASLREALGFEPEHRRASELLADYYWLRFREAEEAQDRRTRDFYGEFVQRYHRGKYAVELKGDGTLALRSEPEGAEAWLHEYVAERCRLVPRPVRCLGKTPLGPVPLPMGSYLVVLRKEGCRDVSYPVFITRNRAWSAAARLYTEEAIGAGFVLVSRGPYRQGGDRLARRSLPRTDAWLDDFFIATHPVTMAEYLEFLNDLARTESLDAARRRGPRPAPEAPTHLREDGRGGLRLPEADAEGDHWDPRLPVLAVSHHDAVAYCAWRSRRDGRRYRLPTQEEWEKAARGVDGRSFPWGNRFDPSLCNMRESRRERPAPVPVDAFPSDVSVYGVRGLAGNASEWTATEIVEGARARPVRVCRGGGWDGVPISVRAASRHWYAPARVFDDVSFRLAASPAADG